MILAPLVASRSCALCQEWAYDEETGQILRQRGTGQPVRRSRKNKPPCRIPSLGCAKGTPETSHALNPRNERCYAHYLQCAATGHWPDDALVRWHARIIVQATLEAERLLRCLETKLLAASITMRSAGP